MQDHEAFIERFKAAWAAKDPVLLGACLAPDATVHPAPVSRTVRGHEMVRFFEQILAVFPDLHLEVRNWAARDATVFIEWVLTATGPDGNPVTVVGVDRFIVENGVGIDEIVVFDTLPLWARLDPTMVRPDLVDLGPAPGDPDSSEPGPTEADPIAPRDRPGVLIAAAVPPPTR